MDEKKGLTEDEVRALWSEKFEDYRRMLTDLAGRTIPHTDRDGWDGLEDVVSEVLATAFERSISYAHRYNPARATPFQWGWVVVRGVLRQWWWSRRRSMARSLQGGGTGSDLYHAHPSLRSYLSEMKHRQGEG